jgi:hypothetical protein
MATHFQSIAGAYFHASGFPAAKAYNRDKTAGHTSGCAYLNRALVNRMVFLINNRTNIHTGKTAQAFVHSHRL